MDARKHRLEKTRYRYDFAPQLASGDALTGTPSLKLVRNGEDKASEFGALGLAIEDGQQAGSAVGFWLEGAGAGEQDGGGYVIFLEADTQLGEHKVAEVRDAASGEYRRPILRVYEDGDLSAP